MAGQLDIGDKVMTPDGKGIVLMPCSAGWDRVTVLIDIRSDSPYQKDYYENQLSKEN